MPAGTQCPSARSPTIEENVMFGLCKRKHRPAPSDVISGLLSLHQSFEGIAIIGGTGSGKTTGPGAEVALNLLELGAGFCVLCAKPDEYVRWERYCELAGRSHDLVRFAPGTDAACDLLGCELAHEGASVEAAAQLLDILIQVSSRTGGGRGEEPFWALFAAKIFRRSIAAIWLGKGKCSLRDIHTFLVSAPTSIKQMSCPDWQKGSFCWEVLEQGKAKCPNNGDFDLCGSFWLNEWPSLGEKTRSVGYAMVTNILDKLLGGPIAPMISGGVTTVGPQDVLNGRVVVLDMPVLQWREPGQFFQVIFKTLVQRAALRRDLALNSRPVCIYGDEAQFFFVPDIDVMTQTVARQARLISVVLTQNLPTLYSASGGGEKARQEVDGWLSSHMTKIALANTCVTTGEYFSKLFGSSYEDVWGGSSGSAENYHIMDDLMGKPLRGGPTLNWSSQWKPDVPIEAFARIQKPCPPHHLAIGYLFQSGALYGNGKPWMKAAFRQTF
jgi:hypothetical protein